MRTAATAWERCDGVGDEYDEARPSGDRRDETARRRGDSGNGDEARPSGNRSGDGVGKVRPSGDRGSNSADQGVIEWEQQRRWSLVIVKSQ